MASAGEPTVFYESIIAVLIKCIISSRRESVVWTRRYHPGAFGDVSDILSKIRLEEVLPSQAITSRLAVVFVAFTADDVFPAFCMLETI